MADPSRLPAMLNRPGPVRVVIVGGGFSGAMVAVQLARRCRSPLVIDIVEPRAQLGAGVAYSATDPTHRINVPASRMTVFDEDPDQFDRWARADGVLEADPQCTWVLRDMIFPQRAVFGRYIGSLVRQAEQMRPDLALRHHRTRVVSLQARVSGFDVELGTGNRLPADIVVLAVSHPPPAVPAAFRAALQQGAPIIADPWAEGALARIDPDASVLVVGTGLSMADIIASLDRAGHRGRITAISRRGLLSRGHHAGVAATRDFFKTCKEPGSALALVRTIRAQVAIAEQAGEPWQAVFDDVRSHARRLWRALDAAERRRVVRHLRPFWDVHRFRVSPQAQAAIAARIEAGQLQTMAASLIDARWEDATLHVRLRQRHDGRTLSENFAAVIVTTGPSHDHAIKNNPALASLAGQGLIRPDGVGLGLDVDDQHRAIGTSGGSRDDLLLAGPLGRNRVGELMGLPQVSEDAVSVADTISRISQAQIAIC